MLANGEKKKHVAADGVHINLKVKSQAYGSQVLYCQKKVEINPPKFNVNRGATAIVWKGLCRFQFTFGQIINILQVKNPGLYAFKTNNTVSQRSNYRLQLFWLSQNMDKNRTELSVLRSRSALNICTGSARTSDNSVWIATKRGCLADLTAF
ncbi:hypothetical protein Tco_0813431 [Tanacetum coccineum]